MSPDELTALKIKIEQIVLQANHLTDLVNEVKVGLGNVEQILRGQRATGKGGAVSLLDYISSEVTKVVKKTSRLERIAWMGGGLLFAFNIFWLIFGGAVKAHFKLP